MTDRDLEQRIRQLLAELSMVSEAESTSFVSTNSAKDTTEAPGGSRPAGPALGVADRWRGRFEQTAEPGRRRTLLLLARRELALIRRRKPLLVDEHGEPEDMLHAEGRLLDWFEGVPAGEAAIYESASGSYCSEGDMRRIRERNDRDPELGLPRMPRQARRAFARRLQAEGKSIRRIAMEMNVAKSTVQRLLDGASDRDSRKGRAA